MKLEYSRRLKIKCKQPIFALYFESESELKFYNLEPSQTSWARYFHTPDLRHIVGNPNRKKMHIFGFVGIFEYIC